MDSRFHLVASDGVDLMVEKKSDKKINYPAIKIKFSYINKIWKLINNIIIILIRAAAAATVL